MAIDLSEIDLMDIRKVKEYLFAYLSDKMIINSFTKGTEIDKQSLPNELLNLIEATMILKRLIKLKEENRVYHPDINHYIKKMMPTYYLSKNA